VTGERGPADLARTRSIIICCGSGGVGKTTISAALALEAAMLGRRACVVTIDPARRLANALGVSTLTNSPSEIPGDWSGSLSAVMLDAKSTFDELIGRYSTDEAQAERILRNRLYRNLTSALSGTQEYMAAEKLYELHSEDKFDIVVVDTPPTHNALDFLDAPGRLTRFLENRIFRMLLLPTRAYLRAVSAATRTLLKAIAKVAGSEMVEDAIAFFQAFEGMEEGFRERAARVEKLMSDEGTAFVLVASPRRDSIDEATHFASKLDEQSIPVEALIVNRVFPRFAWPGWEAVAGARPGPAVGPASDRARPGAKTDAGAEAGAETEAAKVWSELVGNMRDFAAVADREESYVADLVATVAPAPVTRIPFLADDVHDVNGLAEIVRHLAGPTATVRT
jgi:anion-transporting  ArsA/GET3 family ATPase